MGPLSRRRGRGRVPKAEPDVAGSPERAFDLFTENIGGNNQDTQIRGRAGEDWASTQPPPEPRGSARKIQKKRTTGKGASHGPLRVCAGECATCRSAGRRP